MIVTTLEDRWRLITQPDHARLSGELLKYWRRTDVADHPRRDELLFAAREHDNGWRETDAAPSWDRSAGRPHSFLTVAPTVRMEIWERGCDRFAGDRPYAALLITLHALHLNRRRGIDMWDAFIDRLEERRDDLLERTGTDPDTATADYRYVELSDTASLVACGGRDEPFETELPSGAIRGGPGEVAGAGLVLDPLPLAGTTTFRVPVRHVPRRRYEGDADLGGELAAARWEELTVRVGAG